VKRDDLTKWLDNYLALGDFQDASLNGLQVEGADEVGKVAFAVDSSLSTLEQAAQTGADMLIVHHGLFWGKPLAITGMHKNRVKYLLENNISLYAAHLPLDAHKEVGNNWGLARILGMTELQDFALHGGKPIGVKGVFPNPITLRDLANTLEQELGESVLVHAGGKARNLDAWHCLGWGQLGCCHRSQRRS
jgi:dinuclear metal center YbgI/SA1388 family protein